MGGTGPEPRLYASPRASGVQTSPAASSTYSCPSLGTLPECLHREREQADVPYMCPRGRLLGLSPEEPRQWVCTGKRGPLWLVDTWQVVRAQAPALLPAPFSTMGVHSCPIPHYLQGHGRLPPQPDCALLSTTKACFLPPNTHTDQEMAPTFFSSLAYCRHQWELGRGRQGPGSGSTSE